MIQAPFVLALLLALLDGGREPKARVSRDPGPREEHFVLELPAPSPSLAASIEVGVVCLRRRAIEGGFQLEGEWLFRRSEEGGGDQHVLHVEQIRGESSRMIFREWGPSRARSLSVDRSADGLSLAFVDTGRGGTSRDAITARGNASMPLELLERIRHAGTMPATCERFEPLSRSLERVEVRRHSPASQGGERQDVRIAELVRADGSTAGRYEFRGSELHSFRSQDGDLVARRVSEEEYRARTPHPAVTIQRP